MNMSSRNLALLEDILDRDCRNMTQEDMETLFKHEMEKPTQEANMKLMQVLLNILNPSEAPQDDWMDGFNQLASSIESGIALDAFISTGGNPYGFETGQIVQSLLQRISFVVCEDFDIALEADPIPLHAHALNLHSHSPANWMPA